MSKGGKGQKKNKLSTAKKKKLLTKNFACAKFLMPQAGVSEAGEKGLTSVKLFSMLWECDRGSTPLPQKKPPRQWFFC